MGLGVLLTKTSSEKSSWKSWVFLCIFIWVELHCVLWSTLSHFYIYYNFLRGTKIFFLDWYIVLDLIICFDFFSLSLCQLFGNLLYFSYISSGSLFLLSVRYFSSICLWAIYLRAWLHFCCLPWISTDTLFCFLFRIRVKLDRIFYRAYSLMFEFSCFNAA